MRRWPVALVVVAVACGSALPPTPAPPPARATTTLTTQYDPSGNIYPGCSCGPFTVPSGR